jgi:outer membrane biosynthesis protein TonB
MRLPFPVKFTLIAFSTYLLLVLFLRFSPAAAAPATHIVISEVQLRMTGEADNEFVELYNPTAASINLTDWKLSRKTSTGTESNLLTSFPDVTIPSHHYLLIAHPTGYTGSPAADLTYSTSQALASNNTVILYNADDLVIDKLGMGTAVDSETATFTSPASGESVERKANSSSTVASMTAGADQLAGNAEDTDDNSADFILRTSPDPQGSASSAEPDSVTPSPSPSPTGEPSPSPVVSPSPSPSPSANYLVISEVQLAITSESTNEFVELYNPNLSAVNLDGWKLSKKTSTGTQSNLVNPFPDVSIPSHQYYLIAHPTGYTGSPSADLVYTTSQSVSANNTIILYNDQDAMVDKLGLGTAVDSETATFTSPASGESVERKASATSTATTMSSGGAEEFAGNHYDTNNNSTNFILRTSPDPQNLTSSAEPDGVTPSPSPSPPVSPSPSPTTEPSPSPSPTVEPTPTVQPTPTTVPTPSPTPTPGKFMARFDLLGLTCYMDTSPFEFGGITFRTPRLVCLRDSGGSLFD